MNRQRLLRVDELVSDAIEAFRDARQIFAIPGFVDPYDRLWMDADHAWLSVWDTGGRISKLLGTLP